MKPGRELDALIAEKVMGEKCFHRMGFTREIFSDTAECKKCDDMIEMQEYEIQSHFKPSTEIKSAWEVVEKLAAYRPSKFVIEKCGAWLVKFDDGLFTPGKTAPHAICLAALKTVGIYV